MCVSFLSFIRREYDDTAEAIKDTTGYATNGAAIVWNDTENRQLFNLFANHTIGLCLNVSAGWGLWGLYGTTSGCIPLSGYIPTLIGMAGGSGSSPTASATFGLLIGNASKPSDLREPFATAGGSADLGLSLGDETSIGEGTCTQTIWANQLTGGFGCDLPIPLPFEFHSDVTDTWT